jgi:transposase
MARPIRFAPEVRERAIRMVLEHQGDHDSQWAAIGAIAAKSSHGGRSHVTKPPENPGRFSRASQDDRPLSL